MAKIAVPELRNGSKKTMASSAPAEDEQTRIARQAYQFFVDRGYQHGFDGEDWLRAEAIVKNKKK